MARKKPSRSQRGALARSSRRKPADVPPAPRVEIAAKKRKSGKPAPRVSKHKKRAAWFRSRVTWPMREASRAARVAERRRASRTLARGDAGQRLGPGRSVQHRRPSDVGGRRSDQRRPRVDRRGGRWRVAKHRRRQDVGAEMARQRPAGDRLAGHRPHDADDAVLRHGRGEPLRRLVPGRRRLPVDQRRNHVAAVGPLRDDGPAAAHRDDCGRSVRQQARPRRRHRLRPRVERQRLRRPLPHDEPGNDLAAADLHLGEQLLVPLDRLRPGDARPHLRDRSRGPARPAASTGRTTAA